MPSSFSFISSLSVIDYTYKLIYKKNISLISFLFHFYHIYESLRDWKCICTYRRYDVHNTNHNGMRIRIRGSDISYINIFRHTYVVHRLTLLLCTIYVINTWVNWKQKRKWEFYVYLDVEFFTYNQECCLCQYLIFKN